MTDMELSSKWLLEKAEEDSGTPLSVGGWILELDELFDVDLQARADARPQELPAVHADQGRTPRHASALPSKAVAAVPVFGNFVNLSRREKGWTVQQLAAKLNVAAGSVVRLESGQSPQPMLVSKIAKVFAVPAKTLLQIAGHATANEAVASASFAFAAKSNTKPLDADQRAALKEFVKALISN